MQIATNNLMSGPLKLIIKTLMPGEPFGPPGIVYISGGAIHNCG